MPAPDIARFSRAARANPRATLIALDVDGTVSAIAATPGEALVDASLRRTLQALAQRYHLWFISGRDADQIRDMLRIEKAGYVGAHGLEIWDAGGLRPLVEAPGLQSQLDQIWDDVTADIPEVAPYAERKRWGVAFHYRAVPRSSKVPKQLQSSIEAHLTPGLRIRSGKQVYEVVPELDHDKGTALGWLIDTLRPRLVFVAGDDLTDVAMFKLLAERRSRSELDGLSVAVLQGRETPQEIVEAADVTVDGVQELHRLVLRLHSSW